MGGNFLKLVFLVITIVAGTAKGVGTVQATPVEPLKISGTLGEEVGGRVSNLFKISPDGKRVVYSVINTAESKTELYSVLVTGGSAVKLSRDIDGFVQDFQISPDSTTVVYRTAATNLNRVPIAGGAAVRVDSDTKPHDGFTYKISAINNRVVYTFGGRLFSAPTNGEGSIVELSTFMFRSLDIGSFELSNDGSKVLFNAMDSATNERHMFVSPVSGGPLVELGTSLANFDPFISQFTSDGNRVVFAAYFLKMGIAETGLFSESLSGDIVRLDDEQIFNSSAFIPFTIAPDGTSVIYMFIEFTAGVDLLKMVPAAGGDTVLLNANMDGNTKICGFSVSPSSSHVGFCAESPASDDHFFYTVATGGGPSVLHNAGKPSDGSQFEFGFSPDGARVAYLITNGADAELSRILYSSPVLESAASQIQDLSATFFCSSSARRYQFTSDSSKLVHCSVQPDGTAVGIAVTSVDGGSTEQLTGASPPPDEYVDFFEVVNNQTHVVYISQSIATRELHIYSVEIPDLLPDEMCFPIATKNGGLAAVCL